MRAVLIMKSILKLLAKFLLGEYAVYHIYRCVPAAVEPVPTHVVQGWRFSRVDQAEILSSADRVVLDQIGYCGADSQAYACLEDSRIIGLCFFWWGARYRTRNFWPLAESEAKLVQIIVLPQMRGRGVAAQLVAYAAADMFAQGFSRLYARIWHSHTSSLKAFSRAGWQRIAIVIEAHPLRRKKTLRLCWRSSGGR